MTDAAAAAEPDPDRAGLRRLSRVLALQPDFKSAIQMMGVHWRQLGARDAALSAFDRAFALDPADPNSLAALAHALKESGRYDLAIAAAERVPMRPPAGGFAAYVRGTLLLEIGETERGIAALIEALEQDPQLRNAHLRLSEAYFDMRRFEDARRHQIQAMRLAGDFAELPAKEMAEARILFICSVSGADLPIGFLFDERRFDLIFTFPADHDGRPVEMPAFDLVFNAIADPDLGVADLGAAERFLGRCARPVLNPPARVPLTRRDRLKALLEGIETTIVPETRRLDRAALEDFAASGASGAFLLRTAGTHGGDDLARIEEAAQALDYAELRPAEFYYVSRFFDYRNGDGYFRKYRLIFIDRKVYPYHLAVMDHWKVHYFRADMVEDAWKRAEEARFLEDYRSVFGEAGARALSAIAERIDLDYAGIDCARLDDGRIVVFEANPAMLVHLDDRESEFPYKHRFVPRIQAAMSALILARAKI